MGAVGPHLRATVTDVAFGEVLPRSVLIVLCDLTAPVVFELQAVRNPRTLPRQSPGPVTKQRRDAQITDGQRCPQGFPRIGWEHVR